MTEIRTGRLLLRRARSEDLDDIHEVLSNAEAMRFWSTPPHRTVEQSREWLESMIDAPETERDDYVVEHQGRVIGKTGCWRLPEIGFILHPAYWGQGLAREALAAAIGRIFERHELASITADVDPRNLASLRLLASLGFAETGRASGTWDVGGELCDSIYLALARPPH